MSRLAHVAHASSRYGERCLRWLIIVLTVGFYAWTANPEGGKRAVTREGNGYFNLLTRGFLKGQLSIDQPADPFLATLKNPYDSVARAGHGPHDATYYRGKYYLYFGVSPVVLLFLPFRILTGWFVEEWCAVLLFSVFGFLIGVHLLASIRRRFLPEAPTWVVVVGYIALATGTMVPALLRRPDVWEVPIACGFAVFTLALFCVWRGLLAEGRGLVWLFLASLFVGLAVGARPVYLPGAVILLLPLILLGRDRAVGWATPQWWRAATCAILPIVAVGLGLAAYNFLRFGNPLEFGWTYQLAGDDNSSAKMFSPGVVVYNFYLYVLSAAGLTPFFPFVTVISPPTAPASHLGMEDPYGLVPNLPWVLLALVALSVAFVRRASRVLRYYCAGTFLACACTLIMVCCFRGAAGRYLVDFAPGFILLGGVGALWIMSSPIRMVRFFGGALVMVLLVWSMAFGVFSSLQHNQLLRAEHPILYARVAHAFDRIPEVIEYVAGAKFGPVELSVILPRDAVGQVEPLVVTGRSFLSDYVFIHYVSADTIRFGFEHTSRGGFTSKTVRVVPGVTHTITVAMGSLFPPSAHPFHDTQPVQAALSRTLRVTLDGQEIIRRNTDFYDAAEWQPSIGNSGNRPAFKRNFSGQILGWKRLAPDLSAVKPEEEGALRLTLKLPAFTSVRAEPLLSLGEPGKGDLIFIRYDDATHISFGHDHWSAGGATSSPIPIDLNREHTVEILCPPLFLKAASTDLIIRVDGTEVYRVSEEFYPRDASSEVVGLNQIGASTAERAFTGEMLRVTRIP